MSRNQASYPERLLASVIGLDECVESRLLTSAWPPAVDRLRVVAELLNMAHGRQAFHGAYGETFESPEMLWYEAEAANREHRQRFGEDSWGWEEWLYWWRRFEQALTARVLGIITGLEGNLESSFLLGDQIRRSSIPSDSQGPGSRNRWEGCGNP